VLILKNFLDFYRENMPNSIRGLITGLLIFIVTTSSVNAQSITEGYVDYQWYLRLLGKRVMGPLMTRSPGHYFFTQMDPRYMMPATSQCPVLLPCRQFQQIRELP
jgi:hypothetical protein